MELRKGLKLIDVFSIASGAMISSGIFILPGLAHARAGPGVVLSYLLAGFWALTGMLSQCELVSAMPKAGGTYFYATRSMGPGVGTVEGLVTWFSLSLKSAFALVGMAAFTGFIVDLDIRIIAVSLCLLFTAINLVGVREAGRSQVVLVAGLLTLMVIYVVRGLPAIEISNFRPFASRGVAAIFATAGFVFISYGGLIKVASIAEEVKEPARNVPLGMILSLLVVSMLYVLVVLVTSGVLGAAKLDNSLTPVSDGARALMGRGGMLALSIAAILAFVSTANAGIMAASRYLLALSRDGLLPWVFRKVNVRFKTPHMSIIFTGVFMISVLFLRLDALVKAASTVLILTYIFSCLSVIIMRESRLQNYQPRFRAPLYPWMQIIGILGLGLLIFEMGKDALAVCVILAVGSFLVYWFYGRIKASREYALLYLMQRIVAKELRGYSMESELKEIIRERDDIIKDRFDQTIEESIVLDISGAMQADEFFKSVAKAMSQRLNVSSSNLLRQLTEREKESSTAISPGLAIPHVIIEGEQTFDVLLARSRKGIFFSRQAPGVHAVFLIAGTRDERNFYLRVLSAIAQIAQDPNFERRFLEAEGEQALRDCVLLAQRRRDKPWYRGQVLHYHI